MRRTSGSILERSDLRIRLNRSRSAATAERTSRSAPRQSTTRSTGFQRAAWNSCLVHRKSISYLIASLRRRITQESNELTIVNSRGETESLRWTDGACPSTS
jgi:hypothetical protein